MTIFVISKSGERLMPTVRPGRVRHLLKGGKAKIVKHNPFTIQLLYNTKDVMQSIEFCEDTGDHHVGVSLKSAKREYISEEYRPLANEKQRHDNCRKLRRTRRNRLRYRKARFDNRKRDEGWLAPSVEHKGEVNLHAYQKYLAICPITSATFEVGAFDTQKLQAIQDGVALPEGNDYQEGPRYNIATLREAVFVRDRYTCVFCGRSVADGVILHAHHALYWKGRHGSQLNELATCCEKCHTSPNHQEGGKLWGFTPKTGFTNMAGAATMNILRWKIVNAAKVLGQSVDVKAAYGSDTKAKRAFLGIEKSHVNDAYAMGEFHPTKRAKTVTWQKVRRNNRILEKFYDAKYIDSRTGKIDTGKELFNGRVKRNKNLSSENLHKYRSVTTSKGHKSIRKSHYSYRPYDTVLYNGKKHSVIGVQSNGKYIKLLSLTGKKSIPKVSLVTSLHHTGGWQTI